MKKLFKDVDTDSNKKVSAKELKEYTLKQDSLRVDIQNDGRISNGANVKTSLKEVKKYVENIFQTLGMYNRLSGARDYLVL